MLWFPFSETLKIDADISKCFDSIPHEKLLKKVAKRIVDKNILKLIKMWLTAPIVEEEDGKKRFDEGVLKIGYGWAGEALPDERGRNR